MTRKYHTLCLWDAHHAAWFDNFGSYVLAEVKAEYADAREGGYKAKHLAIITTDETAAAMMQARDALPAPK